jgi:hypothetical protein
MAISGSSVIPGPTLFEYLSDDALELVESHDDSSVYSYTCGCVAVHWFTTADCYVRWCPTHLPWGLKRHLRAVS